MLEARDLGGSRPFGRNRKLDQLAVSPQKVRMILSERTASLSICDSATCAARTREAESPRAEKSASQLVMSSCLTSASVIEPQRGTTWA
jgi:hypothetical protein